MNIHYHKNFLKSFRNRIVPHPDLVEKFKQRLELLIQDPKNPILRDHVLKGAKSKYRSFSVTGNIRVVYERVHDGILLQDIGTHNQVY